MKKNFIAVITAAAMLIPTAAVFAADEPALDAPVESLEIEAPEIQGDIMLIDAAAPVEDSEFAPVYASPSYISSTVTVTAVEDGKISTTTNTEDSENPENTINFMIKDETVVLDSAAGEEKKVEDIKEGDVITVFSGVFEPAPLMLPPLYAANVIVINNLSIDSLRFADVDTYVKDADGNLVNLGNTLQISLGKNTVITGLKGKMVTEDELENKDLAVIYTNATKSVPAQTTPIAIAVLGENEQALALYEASKAETEPVIEHTDLPETTDAPEDFEVDFTKTTAVKVGDEIITNVYVKDGNLFLPLRKIAETLGMTVTWDGNLRAVMINDGKYSLQIGQNSYVKGKMAPVELSAAPELTNDLTYVPADYFMEVIETAFTLNGENTLELSAIAE